MKKFSYAVVVSVSLLLSGTVVPGAADSVRVLKDLDYVDGADYADQKDKLDLYLPDGTNGFPVLVFFHGGGLRGGNKDESAHVGQALAKAGIGAAVVNYRLSPAVSHPVHAEDAARSIAWVRSHVRAYGGDPSRLYISGHSAGAYLAALLALDGRFLKAHGISPRDLAGVIPISGFFYVDQVAPDRPKDVWGEDSKVWAEASPSRYLSPEAPPLLFIFADGDEDWRRKQNREIAAELEKKGHRSVRAVEIAGRDHTGIWRQIGPGDETLEKMTAFVKNRPKRGSH